VEASSTVRHPIEMRQEIQPSSPVSLSEFSSSTDQICTSVNIDSHVDADASLSVEQSPVCPLNPDPLTISNPSELKLDFGSRFSLGGFSVTRYENISSFENDDGEDFDAKREREEIRSVDLDMDMKSALDRLLDDVAGGKLEDISLETVDTDPGYERDSPPPIVGRAATDSLIPLKSTWGNDNAEGGNCPPPVPPKDSIRSREVLVLETRREMRRLEEVHAEPFHHASQTKTSQFISGRPHRRRSMSTGDASGGLLTGRYGLDNCEGDRLTESIENELRKLEGASKVSETRLTIHS
jgi:hypothetical protein